MLRQILIAATWLVRSPIAAYHALLDRKPYSLVRWIILLGMSPIVGLFFVESLGTVRVGEAPLPKDLLYILVPVLTPIFVLTGWTLQSFILTVFSRLAGSRVPFRVNLLIFGYAQVPYLLSLPALFLPLDFLRALLFFLNGWSLVFLYLGLNVGHGLGRGRTLFILIFSQLLAPLFIAAVLAMLLGSSLTQ
ncbi:MAG: Yip1 family protein [Bacteroidota bacterium]